MTVSCFLKTWLPEMIVCAHLTEQGKVVFDVVLNK